MSKAKATPKNTTLVALVIDKSSSIADYGLTDEIIKFYNDEIAQLKGLAQAENHNVVVTTIFFNGAATVHTYPTDVRNLTRLSKEVYIPYGSTSMMDAVKKAVDTLKTHTSPAYLIKVLTDGESNADLILSKSQFKSLLKDLEEDGDWTVGFNVPKGQYKNNLVNYFGVPAGNVYEWETTSKGLETANAANRVSTQSYFTSRSAGATKVAALYADVDLAALKKKELRDLDDVTSSFKIYEVSKEEEIKPFLLGKTKADYVTGAGYYQLTKPEKVQPDKKVVIMKKGESNLYGGDDARELVGIPLNVEVRVNPKNLADYLVFIQSKAPNRKLVRGTRVLWDYNLKQQAKPTWGTV
jgi:hypothetical protein